MNCQDCIFSEDWIQTKGMGAIGSCLVIRNEHNHPCFIFEDSWKAVCRDPETKDRTYEDWRDWTKETIKEEKHGSA
jgi:hypothetical protein